MNIGTPFATGQLHLHGWPIDRRILRCPELARLCLSADEFAGHDLCGRNNNRLIRCRCRRGRDRATRRVRTCGSLIAEHFAGPIAERLKAQEEPLADNLNAVTVLFSDIAGFTNLSRGISAKQLVTLLNELFNKFDMLVEKYRPRRSRQLVTLIW